MILKKSLHNNFLQMYVLIQKYANFYKAVSLFPIWLILLIFSIYFKEIFLDYLRLIY